MTMEGYIQSINIRGPHIDLSSDSPRCTVDIAMSCSLDPAMFTAREITLIRNSLMSLRPQYEKLLRDKIPLSFGEMAPKRETPST